MKKKIKISLIIDKDFYKNQSNVKTLSNILALQDVVIDSFFLLDQKTIEIDNNFSFSKLLRKLIFFVEKKFISTQKIVLSNKLSKKINQIKKYNLKILNDKKNSLNFYIDKQQSQEIKNKKLEILINLTDVIILSKINNITLKGIIGSVKEKHTSRNLFTGFNSSYKDVEYVNIFLYLIKDNYKKINIIDIGYYNPKKYWLLNLEFLKEKSNIILFKNIKLILSKNKINVLNKVNNNNNYIRTRFLDLFLYILDRYIFCFFKINKIENWSLKLINSKFNLDFNFKENLNFSPPLNYFWADPFLFKNKNKEYVFFENFDMKEKKGKISYFNLDNPKKIFDIIKKKYHLSYPFIFNFKKKIFMIPETSQNKRVELWKAKNFPKKWTLYKTFFVGESVADCSILNFGGQLWLFVNKSNDRFNDHDSELYIFKIKNNNFNNFEPHKLNPVICDSRTARNAGSFFKYKNKYYRPSQININKIYGYGLNINEIIKLDLNNYREKTIKKIISKDGNIHHLSSLKDKYIFDKK